MGESNGWGSQECNDCRLFVGFGNVVKQWQAKPDEVQPKLAISQCKMSLGYNAAFVLRWKMVLGI